MDIEQNDGSYKMTKTFFTIITLTALCASFTAHAMFSSGHGTYRLNAYLVPSESGLQVAGGWEPYKSSESALQESDTFCFVTHDGETDDLTERAQRSFGDIKRAIEQIQARQSTTSSSTDTTGNQVLLHGVQDLITTMKHGNQTAYALAAQLAMRARKPIIPYRLSDTRSIVSDVLKSCIVDYAKREKFASKLWWDKLYRGDDLYKDDICALLLLIEGERLSGVDKKDGALFVDQKQKILREWVLSEKEYALWPIPEWPQRLVALEKLRKKRGLASLDELWEVRQFTGASCSSSDLEKHEEYQQIFKQLTTNPTQEDRKEIQRQTITCREKIIDNVTTYLKDFFEEVRFQQPKLFSEDAVASEFANLHLSESVALERSLYEDLRAVSLQDTVEPHYPPAESSAHLSQASIATIEDVAVIDSVIIPTLFPSAIEFTAEEQVLDDYMLWSRSEGFLAKGHLPPWQWSKFSLTGKKGFKMMADGILNDLDVSERTTPEEIEESDRIARIRKEYERLLAPFKERK